MKTLFVDKLLAYFRKNRSDDDTAIVLRQFAEIEADSAWQYLHAIQHSDDPTLKRLLFRNVIEECEHADIFNSLSRNMTNNRTNLPVRRRKALSNSELDLPGFLAYVSYSESSVHKSFRKYADLCSDFPIAQAFRNISQDEEKHESETLAYLVKLLEEPSTAHLKMRRAKFKHMAESWAKNTEWIGKTVINTILTLIFFLYGGFLRLFLGKTKKAEE